MELIERIKAAIDEDERVWRCAYPRAAFTGPSHSPETHRAWGIEADQAFSEHAVRHGDPARVLRQVVAHRKILEIHARYQNPYNSTGWACGSCDEFRHETAWNTEQGCPTVLALAEAYGIEP